MSFINYNAKEINCKIVYYGPSYGGKTTNVQWIYQKLNDDQKSKMIVLNTENERTVLYDFWALFLGDIRGFKTKLHLYTVPGQVVYDNYRKLILKGLDGVVFVADSQPDRMEENITAMRNLETNLQQQGYDITQVPVLLQYNKRDAPDALPIEEMRRQLNKYNFIEHEAIAAQGEGVWESLKTVTKSVVNILKGGDL